MPAFRGFVWYSARLTRYDYFHTLDRMKTAISIPDPIFQAAELFAHQPVAHYRSIFGVDLVLWRTGAAGFYPGAAGV